MRDAPLKVQQSRMQGKALLVVLIPWYYILAGGHLVGEQGRMMTQYRSTICVCSSHQAVISTCRPPAQPVLVPIVES